MTREQFFDSVSIGGFDACWWWRGPLTSKGYGSVHRNKKAHRVVYEFLREPIPAGRVLHHVCEERSCVNPKHLMVLTRAEHKAIHGHDFRREQAERSNAATHCKRGHEWTPENIYINKTTGTRTCRACMRFHARNAYYKKKKT